MRGFIILCLAAAASADVSGYAYNRGVGGGSGSGSGSSGLGFGLGGGLGNSGFLGGGNSGLSGGSSGGFGGSSHIQQQQQQQQQQQPIVQELSKEFYTYTAPEEDFNDPQLEDQVASMAKKNLQVIFIHAPQQAGLNRAVQNLAQQTLEQQTAIYVLTKQADLSHLANSLQRETNHVAHKPEVHFIKYRTEDDANRAQQSIRAQYESLGGSTSQSNEGVAPVLNFASQRVQAPAGAQTGQGHHNGGSIVGGQQQSHAIQVPSQNYLPIRF